MALTAAASPTLPRQGFSFHWNGKDVIVFALWRMSPSVQHRSGDTLLGAAPISCMSLTPGVPQQLELELQAANSGHESDGQVTGHVRVEVFYYPGQARRPSLPQGDGVLSGMDAAMGGDALSEAGTAGSGASVSASHALRRGNSSHRSRRDSSGAASSVSSHSNSTRGASEPPGVASDTIAELDSVF